MVPLIILAIEDPIKRAKYSDAYTDYSQHLIAVAKALLKDDSLAEDAVHDAFASLIAADKLPDDALGQKALLTTIVRNKSLDMIKKQKHIAYEEPSEAQQGYTTMTETIELYMLIGHLPESLRDVLIMHYENDLKAKEIADILDISVEAVYKRLERAKAALRKEYLGE